MRRGDGLVGRLAGARTGGERDAGDRVTTVELFFDLVYVFAFTQVTAIMADRGDAVGVAQGLGALGLVWWSWTGYAWLANQGRADRGIVRIGVLVATGLMFLVTLAMPQAFHDRPGATLASWVFVLGILGATAVHAVAYLWVSGDDRALRRQIARSLVTTTVPVAALLVVGAAIGGAAQTVCWLVAPLLEGVLIIATSRHGDWRVRSLGHFAERYGLVVMLALGESVVAVATGLDSGRGARGAEGGVELTPTVLVASTLGVLIALALWWQYFDRFSGAVETQLGRPRAHPVDAITAVYTYLHLPLVAGVIIAALGVERATHAAGEGESLGAFGAIALATGPALYCATGAVVARVASSRWPMVRLVAGAALVAEIPLLAVMPSVGSLALVAATVIASILVETVVDRRRRPTGAAPEPTAEAAGSVS